MASSPLAPSTGLLRYIRGATLIFCAAAPFGFQEWQIQHSTLKKIRDNHRVLRKCSRYRRGGADVAVRRLQLKSEQAPAEFVEDERPKKRRKTALPINEMIHELAEQYLPKTEENLCSSSSSSLDLDARENAEARDATSSGQPDGFQGAYPKRIINPMGWKPSHPTAPREGNETETICRPSTHVELIKARANVGAQSSLVRTVKATTQADLRPPKPRRRLTRLTRLYVDHNLRMRETTGFLEKKRVQKTESHMFRQLSAPFQGDLATRIAYAVAADAARIPCSATQPATLQATDKTTQVTPLAGGVSNSLTETRQQHESADGVLGDKTPTPKAEDLPVPKSSAALHPDYLPIESLWIDSLQWAANEMADTDEDALQQVETDRGLTAAEELAFGDSSADEDPLAEEIPPEDLPVDGPPISVSWGNMMSSDLRDIELGIARISFENLSDLPRLPKTHTLIDEQAQRDRLRRNLASEASHADEMAAYKLAAQYKALHILQSTSDPPEHTIESPEPISGRKNSIEGKISLETSTWKPAASVEPPSRAQNPTSVKVELRFNPVPSTKMQHRLNLLAPTKKKTVFQASIGQKHVKVRLARHKRLSRSGDGAGGEEAVFIDDSGDERLERNSGKLHTAGSAKRDSKTLRSKPAPEQPWRVSRRTSEMRWRSPVEDLAANALEQPADGGVHGTYGQDLGRMMVEEEVPRQAAMGV